MKEAQKPDTQVTTQFSPTVYEGLRLFAEDKELDLPGAVETTVREKVRKYLDNDGRRQIDAEADLMAFVDDTVRDWREAGSWTQHVTGDVFNKIKSEKLNIYQDAIGDDPFLFGNQEKARINRRIGARVKRLLGATVVIEGGGRAKGQPSRTERALVMSYSLLKPSS